MKNKKELQRKVQININYSNLNFLIRQFSKKRYTIKKKLIQFKVDLCCDVMYVFNKQFPGFSDVRGRIIYEQAYSTFLLTQLEFQVLFQLFFHF